MGDDSSSRFSPITETDHAGFLWIITPLSIIYTGLSCLLRIWIKRGLYGWDDLLLIAGTVVHFAQTIPIFTALRHGLAQFNSNTYPNDWAVSGKAFLASEVLTLVALGLSKCSVLAMMLRVFTPDRALTRLWKACFAFSVLSALWTVGSILAVAINCDGATLLTTQKTEKCPHQFVRWQAITAINITTDIIICIIPAALTWSLNMATKLKVQVVLAFGFRIFIVPLSAYHLRHFSDYLQSTEPQFAITESLVFQQAMLTVSLITATIPNLKTFMKSFNTMGFGLEMESSAKNSESYALQTIGGGIGSRPSNKGAATSFSRDRDARRSMTPRHRPLRPDGVQHEVLVSHVDRMSDTTTDGHSLTRTGSQDMIIITKEVEWNVRHEQR